MKQKYSSKDTSINKNRLPVVYSIGSDLIRGKKCIDYGCGKYNNAIDYAKAELNAVVVPYDKYNRTETENAFALSQNYDLLICSNVLNVIAESEIRNSVIAKCASLAPVALFTVYEGDGTGNSRVSKNDCWQENRKTETYILELKTAYKTVTKKGKLLICLA